MNYFFNFFSRHTRIRELMYFNIDINLSWRRRRRCGCFSACDLLWLFWRCIHGEIVVVCLLTLCFGSLRRNGGKFLFFVFSKTFWFPSLTPCYSSKSRYLVLYQVLCSIPVVCTVVVLRATGTTSTSNLPVLVVLPCNTHGNIIFIIHCQIIIIIILHACSDPMVVGSEAWRTTCVHSARVVPLQLPFSDTLPSLLFSLHGVQ